VIDNYPEAGKRPLSSMTPAIMEYEDGNMFLSIGGAGGSQILTAIFQVIMNLDWGMNVRDGIEYGRMHDQLYPVEVDVDSVYPSWIVERLREKGHNVTGEYYYVILLLLSNNIY